MSKQGVVIGLTGGIASGKSTVSKHLTALGAWVLDADKIARDIVIPGAPAFLEIVETFGHQVVGQDGALDRAKLGAIVFEQDDARAKLNAITHPRIAMGMMEGAQRGFDAGHAWAIYDAALLVENKIHTMFDALIVVAASSHIQFQRLLARDDLDQRAAQARIDAQYPVSKKIDVADYVIDNDGTLAQTLAQTQRLYEMIESSIGKDNSAKPETQVWLGPIQGKLTGAQS